MKLRQVIFHNQDWLIFVLYAFCSFLSPVHLQGLKWQCLVPCTLKVKGLRKEQISSDARRARKTWPQSKKWIRESGRRAFKGPLCPPPCFSCHWCVRAHEFQVAEWFLLLSLYSVFDCALCWSSSSDFPTKCFAAYTSKLKGHGTIRLVVWYSDEYGTGNQCWGFHNRYY